MKIQLSIIFVYYNTPNEVVDAIDSISKSLKKIIYEIIVVDNNSDLPLPLDLRKNKKIKIIYNKKNEGFGKGMNIGFKKSRGKYIILSNPDVIFQKNSVLEMLSLMEKDPRIGVVGPKHTDSKGRRLKSVSSFPFLPGAIFAFSILNKLLPNNPFSRKYWLSGLNINKDQEVDVIGGACMMIKRKSFEEAKGFDENFFLYFEESDLCLRIKKLGYKIVYHPESQIVHLVGRSLKDKDKIEKYFETSRLYFFKKYHGFLAGYLGEMTIRILKPKSMLLISVLLISSFLNLYRLNDLMLFFGDAARDYLAARDMVLSGVLPLVGIPSSVVWLHQGPLSIYLIGLSFILSNFNPIAPAILYAVLGVLGTYLVYKLGVLYFNPSVGLVAALFYATSPLIVINARMPYHTSSIPVIASLFFILLYKVISGNKKYLFILFFVYGLLLQVELSNIILVLIIFFLYIVNHKKINLKNVLVSIFGFMLGIFPFIIYDFKNHFVYSIGFPLWILNRVRLFFGIAADKNATIHYLPGGAETILQQISGIIFPSSAVIAGFIAVFIIFELIFNYKLFNNKPTSNNRNLILLWVAVPLIAYLVHTSPGTAYFPLVFPAVSLIIGIAVYKITLKQRFIVLSFLLLCFYNSFILVKNDFFVTTFNKSNPLPPFAYNLGSSWLLSDTAVKAIILDSGNAPFNIRGGDFFSTITTGVDTYRYLALWRKGKLDEKSKLIYLVFDKSENIPLYKKVFEDKFTVVLKYETK